MVDAPVSSRRWGDLATRALSGIVLVVVAVGTAREGGHLFLLVWIAASIAVLVEWQRLIDAPALPPRIGIGAVAIGLAGFLAHRDLLEAFTPLVIAAVLMAVLAPGRRLWAAGGVFYAGLLVLATVSLRFSFPFGARSIIWLFATVWSTDTFAYFGGRLIGGPKIAPRISPSKTWSGTLAGVTAGTLIGTFAAVRDLPTPTPLVPILLVTLGASVLSQAGDAFESAMKRYFGVKDSGRIIPGHGGVMDRLDGFIAAAVFAFALGLARNGPSIAGGLFYWS